MRIFILALLCSCLHATTAYHHPPIIMIDPGHGGKDEGTRSLSKPYVLEKRLTLFCAEHVQKALRYLGYLPKITRHTDQTLSLKERVEKCHQCHASVLVSIHFNAAANPQAQGIEVFFPKGDSDRARDSRRLAQAVLKRTLELTCAKNRHAKPESHHVTRETRVPAILIEGGFVTNEEELKKLKDPIYMKKIAHGIAKGIDDYYLAHHPRRHAP